MWSCTRQEARSSTRRRITATPACFSSYALPASRVHQGFLTIFLLIFLLYKLFLLEFVKGILRIKFTGKGKQERFEIDSKHIFGTIVIELISLDITIHINHQKSKHMVNYLSYSRPSLDSFSVILGFGHYKNKNKNKKSTHTK